MATGAGPRVGAGAGVGVGLGVTGRGLRAGVGAGVGNVRTTGGATGWEVAGRGTVDPPLGGRLKCSSPGTRAGLGAGVGAGVGWLVWAHSEPVADVAATPRSSIEQARTRRAAFLVIIPTRLP